MSSIPVVARKPPTLDDLHALPEGTIGEIISGELIAQPRPGLSHVRAASRLGMKVGGPFDLGSGGPGGWVILHEPELHLDTDVLVPDLAGWRRERLPGLPESAALTLAPDWVCEVISPDSHGRDRVAKMRIYSRERVAYAWLVDPIAKLLEVFRLDGSVWTRLQSASGSETLRAEPFGAIELDLASLWER